HLRIHEEQEPLLIGGYYHEWNPELHTLLLAGRFHDDFHVSDPQQPVLFLGKDGNTGDIYAAPTPGLPTATLNYRTKPEIYSAELQQIWQHDRLTVILGGRYQTGTFDTQSQLGTNTPTHLQSGTNVSVLAFSGPGFTNDFKPDFERWSAYAYYNLRVFDPL